MVVNKTEKRNNNIVKFIDYTGKWPNLCSGTLTLEINGKIYKFKPYPEDKENVYERFWHSGGSCGLGYLEEAEWVIDESLLPDELKEYVDLIDRVMNANVPFGCCGGYR